ncbi:ATP dependent RNA helicase [Sporothrix schenckii 1099-18]|uniref:RNA helicase n=1 Tax=Sporothrix schenckii 1099-18 TaxID=1397361 RepID=A0A0F2M477_SPOSC|nr:ATP dependent RNA helicase [Sporothrix schenckii 1099-18]KJR84503.1 ATP dependent RNA helicase [Sporothrix schenckii 1099-18]
MAGNKKKRKPAASAARGFATTSIASKPRADPVEGADATSTPQNAAKGKVGAQAPATSQNSKLTTADSASSGHSKATAAHTLSPEEFEKQLEESELQLLVEKYAQKVRRDAARQFARLETDRRILRGQAESVNSKKWIPQELMDQILDLIQSESRFAASNVGSETLPSGKLLSEEDLTIKLWTLEQALELAGFPDDKVQAVLKYVLDISTQVGPGPKDSIWGLEEALEWLARESSADELPDYSKQGALSKKGQTGDTSDTPLASGATTPSLLEADIGQNKKGKPSSASRSPKGSSSKQSVITFDGDIEPEELGPVYLDTKARLFTLQRPLQVTTQKGRLNNQPAPVVVLSEADKLETAKLLGKLERIENDILFDRKLAEMQWRSKKIILEREFSEATKKAAEEKRAKAKAKEEAAAALQDDLSDTSDSSDDESEDEVSKEAKRVAAEILAEDDSDDDAIADLFASLPVSEVDPNTGKTNTVVNSSDGSKVIIRDFGTWIGVSPVRALEEACRARDSSVRISYQLVSDISFANRHMVSIAWTKPQEIPQLAPLSDLEVAMVNTRFVFKMVKVATPDAKQSEAFIATAALFFVFGASAKEEKVAMRLPPAWRDLWSEFAKVKKSQADSLDREAIKKLRDLVSLRRDQELEDGVVLQGAFRGRAAGRSAADSGEDSGIERGGQSVYGPEYYQRIWQEKSSTPKYQAMLQSRMQLPMWAFRDRVLEAVEREQVVIVCGETGCGKSTQVPSFLLEHQLAQGKQCKIYCTEPRRISAISLARRVSEELGEGRNDLGTPRSLVGFSIRLEANTSKETRLVFATTGIVMRMLEGSNDLREITHLVLDEVHERSIDSDFLLIVLKKLLTRRKDLKVVLMSATVDAERFSKYLGGAPVLNVPGRTFPVQVQYLEDAVEATGYSHDQRVQEKNIDLDDDLVDEIVETSSKPELLKSLKDYSNRTRNTLAQMDEYQIQFDLIVQLISQIATSQQYIKYSQAILVFLPGIAEIRTLNDLLLGDKTFAENWLIYPLHSTIATEEQEAAFLVPPPGYRKIVLATNIAETGITIPDVTCVIDTGKHREMRFDERRQLSRLIDTFISRANAKQRRGRAGRVQEGLCFHLFTKYRHDQILSDQQTPEMLRLSLQDLAIRVKMCKIGAIQETLGQALDPPSEKNIRRAIDALVDVRALTASEELTPLGIQLARLPLDVFLGKLVLMGTVFKCLDMAITVAAILSSKSPFTAPFGQRAQADTVRLGFRRGDSDLLTVYNAYLAWKRVCQSAVSAAGGGEFQFCKKNFLSIQTLTNIEDLKGQLLVSLVDSGFLPLTYEERRNLNKLRYSSSGRGGRRRQQAFFELPQRVNINSDVDIISQSVISWSFYPRLLVRDAPGGGNGLRNIGNNQAIRLHPSSVNRGHNELRWLSYYNIMQSKSLYNAHETTAVEAFPIALLCGDMRCDMFSGVLILDGNRARFAVPDWKTLLVIKVLRSRLRDMLSRSFKAPGKQPTAQHQKWFDVWQRIFAQDFGSDNSTALASASASVVVNNNGVGNSHSLSV